ncbi:MAG: S8 family peptidase [Planctomycetaceae bacterium]|jgi:hypothetical protein|nr:S8 family peptidase [Planctomycetaceae bacterium]
MSESERRAVFYKLTHERPVNLSGIGLTPICEPSDHYSLVIADKTVQDFSEFEKRITSFSTGNEDDARKVYGLVANLKQFEEGQPKDRLCEKLYTCYDQLIQEKDQKIIIEIEIVNIYGDGQSLGTIRQEISDVLKRGSRGMMFEHEEFGNSCRAVIRCNGEAFKELVEGQKWQTKIFWFETKPEFETLHSIIKDFQFKSLKPIIPPDKSAPVVCVIDTGVTKENPFLSPVCCKDVRFFKSFLRNNDNPYDEYGHGSGVASLVSYYALNINKDAQNSGKVWIANARVLNAENKCEDETLFSKVLEEVVEYFHPLGVRIFNLSLSIVNRHWNEEQKRTVPRKSWIARKIDELSLKYDVVFVICTGNLSLEYVNNEIENGTDYPQYFRNDSATIFDPAQAALALSVGALSPSTLVVGRAADFSAVASKDQPAPFTRRGPGIDDEIKPEIIEYGGNYIQDTETRQIQKNPGTDVFVASHQLTPALIHNVGTSFAAPRISHRLALILQDLQTMDIKHPSSALLKALLVNSTVNLSEMDSFEDRLNKHFQKGEAKKLRRLLCGYGLPDEIRATECNKYTVILYFDGVIEADKVALFRIPIPESLQQTGRTNIKCITITTCHLPEVQKLGIGQYLGTDLKWRLFRGDSDQNAVVRRMSHDDDDTNSNNTDDSNDKCIHEIKDFHYKITERSKGCIQHDFYEYKQHSRDFSTNPYILAITAYKKWIQSQKNIPFAVVVRIEDKSNSVPIYSDVKALVEAQVEVVNQ